MKMIDLVGELFGELTVIRYVGLKCKKHHYWLCSCSCGNSTEANTSNLRSGRTVSCGCKNKPIPGRPKNHLGLVGGKRTTTYASWLSMKDRCYRVNNEMYKYYGGKGITVCDRWLHSFSKFLKDMGERPQDNTLDRIEGSKGYYADNCRWADRKTQSLNRSNTIVITKGNVTDSLNGWSKRLGIGSTTVYRRYKAGKDIFSGKEICGD